MEKAELREYIKRYKNDLSWSSIYSKKDEIIKLIRELGDIKIEKPRKKSKEVKKW